MKHKTKKQLSAEIRDFNAKKEKVIDEYIKKKPGSIYVRWREEDKYYNSPEYAKLLKEANEKKNSNLEK